MTPKLKKEILAKLDEVMWDDGGISFCGCYEGDIENRYPDAVVELIERFSKKLDEMGNES